ncbi:Glycosyl-phosphatidyl inositol-anchored, plant [Corchorus olitorius]|uniref:Glycosyl-phosphatidyl inositol-anchored, plant n=1 Tax=Corchorus olitorius TaxID=93759 RepID=A0A1R3IBD5_9ROSI|nr:Glycosyl-phosphatidyl inositol-anchored, plant [Corchorus olitorius]
MVELLHGVPPNQQVRGCCKGGLLGSSGQNRAAAVSSFQITVGHSVTWTVTCTYSLMLASKNPICCVSLSSFYSPLITPCPDCACGCLNKEKCTIRDSTISSSTVVTSNYLQTNGDTQLLLFTKHMCPIQVHWHVKVNYKKYWRVKMSITNFYYHMNYSHWNLVVQHPNLNNVIQVDNFTYKLLFYQSTDDSGVFYGVKDQNELLMGDRASGNVQSKLIFDKDESTFTLEQGWAFPRKVYFNCTLTICCCITFHIASYSSILCGLRMERQKRKRKVLLLGWKYSIIEIALFSHEEALYKATDITIVTFHLESVVYLDMS